MGEIATFSVAGRPQACGKALLLPCRGDEHALFDHFAFKMSVARPVVNAVAWSLLILVIGLSPKRRLRGIAAERFPDHGDSPLGGRALLASSKGSTASSCSSRT